jgi:hypothetical protein
MIELWKGILSHNFLTLNISNCIKSWSSVSLLPFYPYTSILAFDLDNTLANWHNQHKYVPEET